METGRNVMHYALGDNQDYEHEWSKAVLEYLENGYSSEDSKSEVEVGNTTYKILKREKVTAFYDADGNTLFDIENDRLKEEYEVMESLDETDPKSEIGRAIAGIEKQAFEQAVDNNIGTDEMIPMGTASLEEIAKGIPAPTPEEVETAKKNNSSVYIGVVGAVTKLQEELKKAKDKSFADPIIKHLIERCRESESLACFAVFGIKNGGGIQNMFAGIGGYTGECSSLFSAKGIEIFLGFGLPTTVGLISGPFGDQCFWQRAFCVKKNRIGRAFFVGAILFGMVPLSMGILGFVGAGMGYTAIDTGVINFELISELFPSWAVIPFLFMIVSGLLSTIDSNLCAISSLTTDIFKKNTLGKTKIAMVALLVIGIIVANIPGLTVTHLFLMYGTLRAATLLPTIFTLKGVKLKPEGVVTGIATALIIGLPVFAHGNITGTAAYKTAGSLLTVLLSGTVALIVSRKRGAENG